MYGIFVFTVAYRSKCLPSWLTNGNEHILGLYPSVLTQTKLGPNHPVQLTHIITQCANGQHPATHCDWLFQVMHKNYNNKKRPSSKSRQTPPNRVPLGCVGEELMLKNRYVG